MSIVTTRGSGWHRYESGGGSIRLTREGSSYLLRMRTGLSDQGCPQYVEYTLSPEQMEFFGYLAQFRVFENANG